MWKIKQVNVIDFAFIIYAFFIVDIIYYILGDEIMDYVMVYWSRYGHNKQIVDYLKEILEKKGHSATILKTSDTDPLSLPDADVYVFSAAVEAFRIQKQMRNFLKKIDKMDGKKCAIINTHAMKKRNWLKSMMSRR